MDRNGGTAMSWNEITSLVVRAPARGRAAYGGLVERLKAVDRATLVAFYLRGRSLKQMSREFETPIGTIKRRLHVARNRLKRALEQAASPGARKGKRKRELACV